MKHTQQGFRCARAYYRIKGYVPATDVFVVETPDGRIKAFQRKDIETARVVSRVTGRNHLEDSSYVNLT